MGLPGRGNRSTPKPVLPPLQGIVSDVTPGVYNVLNAIYVSLQRFGAHLENQLDSANVATDQTRMRVHAGANPNVPAYLPYSSYILTGPTAAYSVSGFTSGEPGRLIVVINGVNFPLTLSNESTASSAVNRITTITGGNVTLGPGASAFFSYDALTSRWIFSGAFDPLGGFTVRGLNTQTFTSTGIFDVPASTSKVFLTGCAAGGGGGGSDGINAGGGGGGGDAIFRRDITVVPGGSYTVTVGAGGAGGTAGGGTGVNGGSSSFGALFSLTGGGGGTGSTGGGGGGTTGGTLAQPGLNAVAATFGLGGISALFPVHGLPTSAQPGVRGQGGNGSFNAGFNAAGGTGGDGYVLIEW